MATTFLRHFILVFMKKTFFRWIRCIAFGHFFCAITSINPCTMSSANLHWRMRTTGDQWRVVVCISKFVKVALRNRISVSVLQLWPRKEITPPTLQRFPRGDSGRHQAGTYLWTWEISCLPEMSDYELKIHSSGNLAISDCKYSTQLEVKPIIAKELAKYRKNESYASDVKPFPSHRLMCFHSYF